MRINVDKILVYMECSIREALEVLDAGGKGIILVVDKNKKLIGTITDGDIRRAILKGISINESIEKVIHYNPVYITRNTTKEEAKDIFIKKAIKDIPVVDDKNIVIDVISINDILLPEGKVNPVVIMAGGLGTRLKSLTKEIPKPMLKVGQEPMLQHIINNFKQYGYNKIILSVNYKAEIIENYFQDGIAYGVKINYVKEQKRLGTAGGIRLAKNFIEAPFFVINGDIFTNLNVESMMKFHLKNKFDMTIGTKIYSYKIPYGIVETEGKKVKIVKEKPQIDYLINGGVYCLNPTLIDYIPYDKYFEITDLIDYCLKKGFKVGNYEIKEYWMDIGKLEDYNKINRYVEESACSKNEGDKDD